MTEFLYHRLPDNLVGSCLYPLNQLKLKLPSVYGAQANKYIGREQNSVIYLYMPENRGQFGAMTKDFVPFLSSTVAELRELPQATADYYQEMAQAGKRPLLFHFVPHVLYRGVINLLETTIIEV